MLMLFSKQVTTIGTENAFKMGAHITFVEKTGKKVIRCNICEPDFPTPAHIRFSSAAFYAKFL